MINKLRGLAGCIALLVAFLFLGSVDASAQETAAPLDNPEIAIAQSLGVNACVLGSATNVQGGINSLEALVVAMRPNEPTASMFDKLKFRYYVAVLQDVRDYSIFPELSLLKNLRHATRMTGGNPSIQQFAGLYNSTKALFGMCQ